MNKTLTPANELRWDVQLTLGDKRVRKEVTGWPACADLVRLFVERAVPANEQATATGALDRHTTKLRMGVLDYNFVCAAQTWCVSAQVVPGTVFTSNALPE